MVVTWSLWFYGAIYLHLHPHLHLIICNAFASNQFIFIRYWTLTPDRLKLSIKWKLSGSTPSDTVYYTIMKGARTFKSVDLWYVPAFRVVCKSSLHTCFYYKPPVFSFTESWARQRHKRTPATDLNIAKLIMHENFVYCNYEDYELLIKQKSAKTTYHANFVFTTLSIGLKKTLIYLYFLV